MPKDRMRGMKQSVPKSVDEYIAAQSEVLRPKLEQVRAVKKLLKVPKAELDARVRRAKVTSPRAGNPNAPGRKTSE